MAEDLAELRRERRAKKLAAQESQTKKAQENEVQGGQEEEAPVKEQENVREKVMAEKESKSKGNGLTDTVARFNELKENQEQLNDEIASCREAILDLCAEAMETDEELRKLMLAQFGVQEAKKETRTTKRVQQQQTDDTCVLKIDTKAVWSFVTKYVIPAVLLFVILWLVVGVIKKPAPKDNETVMSVPAIECIESGIISTLT